MRRLIWTVVLLISCAEAGTHDSDAVFRERFRRNGTHFEAIKEIFVINPKLGVLDANGFALDHAARMPPPDLQVAEPYRSEYAAILSRLRVQSVVRRADGKLAFIGSESGEMEKRSAKGFEHSKEPLQPRVRSLDDVNLQCGDVYYSRIEEHWYLYLQSYCS